jgi:20S proteasome subunit beta 7
MDHHPARWGQPRTQTSVLSCTGFAALPQPVKRTSQPIVTGTSVLGLVYKDGIMLTADTLG